MTWEVFMHDIEGIHACHGRYSCITWEVFMRDMEVFLHDMGGIPA